jgi:hypothetical protein
MDDVQTSLKSASRLVTVPDRSFDRLLERRDRVRRRQRLASFVVAVVVGAGSVAGVAILLSNLGQAPRNEVGTGWQPTRRLALRPGEYFYLRIESSEAEDGHIRDEETWWGIDGSGEVRNRSTRQDKYPYPPSGIYGRGEFPIDVDVSELSTDASVLADQFRHEPWNRWLGETPSPGALWIFTRVLLLDTPQAPPELRAAVFEMASCIEDVIVTERPGSGRSRGNRAPSLRARERSHVDDVLRPRNASGLGLDVQIRPRWRELADPRVGHRRRPRSETGGGSVARCPTPAGSLLSPVRRITRGGKRVPAKSRKMSLGCDRAHRQMVPSWVASNTCSMRPHPIHHSIHIERPPMEG